MNRCSTGIRDIKEDPKEKIAQKMKFIDNYNLWLNTREENTMVSIRVCGVGSNSDIVYEGIVKRVGKTKIVVEILFQRDLRALIEFWRTRTLGDGYPRTGEMMIEPHKQEKSLLAQRIAQKTIEESLRSRECEFEFDNDTLEMKRSY